MAARVLLLCAVLAGVTLTLGTKQSPHIIDGWPSRPGRFPYIVSITTEEEDFRCGGALVTPIHVLTAAHCVVPGDNEPQETFYASFGVFNRTAHDQTETIRVEAVTPHPRFSQSSPRIFDIAILHLEYEVTLIPRRVDMVMYATWDQNFQGWSNCLIAGWGRTLPGGDMPISPVLYERNVSLLTQEECQRRWSEAITRPTIDRRHHLCVDDEGGKVSACQGDSGSPLVCPEDGMLYLVGLSSWGSGACQVYPSVYTRISRYSRWIIRTIIYGHDDGATYRRPGSAFSAWLQKYHKLHPKKSNRRKSHTPKH